MYLADSRPPGPTNGLSSACRRPWAGDPRPLFGFFTRVSLGGGSSIEAVIAAFPLVPLVGWATGLAGALAALVLGHYLPPEPLAAVLLVTVVGLTGLNATDGLLDLGDALMVHGDVERRLAVMHDPSAGVGAIGLVLFTYLVAFAGLAGLAELAPALVDRHPGAPGTSPAMVVAMGVLVCEVFARLPYLALAWLGHASHSGLGAAFLEGFGIRQALVGLACAAPVALAGIWLGWPALALSLGAALLTGALLLRTANRLLGGVGGDVFGASQELGRAAGLLALVLGLALQVS